MALKVEKAMEQGAFVTMPGNEQLSPQQDFTIKTLECWAFQM